MMQHISGIAPLAARYDGFILDLWGVIHDGTCLYPSVHDTLVKLRETDKKVMFLSNAPRRARKVEQVLNQLGIRPDLYDHILSSGEAGYQWLAQSDVSPLGSVYFYIGPDKDLDVLDGLHYTRVYDVSAADFILNVGFGSEDQPEHAYEAQLKKARARGLAMVCLNPDLEVVKISGERFACAGVMAHYYESIGGRVVWFGKPYDAVYQRCEALLLPVSKDRLLAVGDSLETDIPGAQHYGIDNMLVKGGILKGTGDEELARLCASLDLRPTYISESFSW